MSSDHLVVIGASLAGLRAVEGARKAGFDGKITLIGSERHLPYDRPPLSKSYLDPPNGSPAKTPTYRSLQILRTQLGAELLLGCTATGLDVDRKLIQLGNRSVTYDAAVIATGACARELPALKGQLAGVHTLRTIDDAEAVRRAFDRGARTVVVGAGFIGSEIASAARKRGLDVTLVEASPTPLVRAVGQEMGEVCATLHQLHGVRLLCGVTVTKMLGSDRVEQVVLSDGSVLPADLIIVGVGADPATDWLKKSGLEIDDGVVCDETLCSGERVYAAGDVARWHNGLFGRSMRLEHWTAAAEQGTVAARNAVDPGAGKPYRTVPYFWSDWYDCRIQFVGISDADEVYIVTGSLDRDPKFLALYRQGDRIVGAFAINNQSVIMKYRRMIAEHARWEDALALATTVR